MNSLKSYFFYNKRQRNGILFLLTLIVLLQLAYFCLDFLPTSKINKDTKIVEFQKQIDSLKKQKKSIKNIKIRPFNPNFITVFKGYKLGLTTTQIDNLLTYRKTGKYVNSVKEFQNITGVNDSVLKIISPFFKFPNWIVKNNSSFLIKKKTLKKIKNTNVKIKDLNMVSAVDLQQINGIGTKLSTRIIKYRNLLHGFAYNDQLYEVWYLDTITANKVLMKFKVLNSPNFKKIDINNATFKELLHVPYINYELTKDIMNFRKENFPIQSIEELKKIEGFPLEKFKRITLYLDAK